MEWCSTGTESLPLTVAVLPKLMMACNDMSLANQALAEWKEEQPRNRKTRAFGARMYFVRTQFGHLYEGLQVIEAIEKDATLKAFVDRCDPKTRQSFSELLAYLPGGMNHADLEALAGRIRHTITFHYDKTGKLIERAIDDLARRGKSSSVTRADTAPDWHFELADIVVDQIVCRQIWSIPETADVVDEANKIADRIHEFFLYFMDFAGEFIWRYSES